MASRGLLRLCTDLIRQASTSSPLLQSTRQQALYSTVSAAQRALKLKATERDGSGKKSSKAEGRVPGVIFSLDNESKVLVSFPAKEVEQLFSSLGRFGWACQVFDVEVAGQEQQPSRKIRALGRQVHVTADTDRIENVTLIECSPSRTVKVFVPITVFGNESCPGIKAGGRVNSIAWGARVLAQGNAIPTSFELDISELSVGDKLHFSDIKVPEGVTLLEDPAAPALKIMRK